MRDARRLTHSLSTRIVRARRALERNRVMRLIGGRAAATLALGAALSVGGLGDTLANVHFLVQKDLDSVRVVRQRGEDEKVVANLHGAISGNAVFKLSRALPDRLVSRENGLFSNEWLTLDTAEAPREKRDVFYEEMKRINDSIRREFFASSMPYGDLIHEKSEKYDVDPALVAAVIEAESRFKSRAKSPVGARGLMQLMPRTGRWMGARDLYDPEQNIDAGVKYIKYLDARFDGNLKKTIAAYNAGEGNVMRYGGIPPFRETRTYVKRVMKNYDKRSKELEKFQKDQLRNNPAEQPEAGAVAR